MTKELPGNDGQWFLELVGVIEPDPDETDTYVALASLEAPARPDRSDTLGTGVAVVTGGLVGDPGAGGVTARRRRREASGRLRWLVPSVVVALAVAATATAVYLLPQAVDDEAASLANGYRSSLATLRSALPDAQRALDVVTDPAATDEDIGAVPATLAALTSAAGGVAADASAALPRTLPFVPRDALDALEPVRDTAVILADEAGALADRIGAAFDFRTAVESMFAMEALPTTAADESEVLDLSIALAADLAETGHTLSELDQDPAFAAVQTAAASAYERYAPWQLEYLDALRSGDTTRAAELNDELALVLALVHDELHSALASVRVEVDAELVELAAELERAIAAVPA